MMVVSETQFKATDNLSGAIHTQFISKNKFSLVCLLFCLWIFAAHHCLRITMTHSVAASVKICSIVFTERSSDRSALLQVGEKKMAEK
jgi:hypothetical protein